MLTAEQFLAHAATLKRGKFFWTKPRKMPGRFTSTKVSELRYGGEVIIKAQSERQGLWFWYGLNRNSACDGYRALAVIQAEARDYAKEILRKGKP